MDAGKKFAILNLAGRFSIVILSTSFMLSFILFVLPRFPAMLADPAGQAWFIICWNLPGPLMFISVFRIHALRIIREKSLGRKNVLGITRWVRFWFFISVMFGVLSLAFLVGSNPVLPLRSLLATAGMVFVWLILVSSTVILLRTKCDRRMLDQIEQARERERVLLALTSIVFLVFTGFSSIVLSLPRV